MIAILVAVKQELNPILRLADARHIIRQEHLDFYEGTLADTGATVFAALTGAMPALGGDVLTAFRPCGGWRRYTPATSCPEAARRP